MKDASGEENQSAKFEVFPGRPAVAREKKCFPPRKRRRTPLRH
jgi:hypothetical protein